MRDRGHRQAAADVAAGDALAHVFGYTAVHGGSMRDRLAQAPLGEDFAASRGCGHLVVIADEVGDPWRLALDHLRDEEVQHTGTDRMLYDVPALSAPIPRYEPLRAGDLVATGSPDSSGGSVSERSPTISTEAP